MITERQVTTLIFHCIDCLSKHTLSWPFLRPLVRLDSTERAKTCEYTTNQGGTATRIVGLQLRGTAVERWSLTSELSLSCSARPSVDR